MAKQKNELPLIDQLEEKIKKDYSKPVDPDLQRMLRKVMEKLAELKNVIVAADNTKNRVKAREE